MQAKKRQEHKGAKNAKEIHLSSWCSLRPLALNSIREKLGRDAQATSGYNHPLDSRREVPRAQVRRRCASFPADPSRLPHRPVDPRRRRRLRRAELRAHDEGGARRQRHRLRQVPPRASVLRHQAAGAASGAEEGAGPARRSRSKRCTARASGHRSTSPSCATSTPPTASGLDRARTPTARASAAGRWRIEQLVADPGHVAARTRNSSPSRRGRSSSDSSRSTASSSTCAGTSRASARGRRSRWRSGG